MEGMVCIILAAGKGKRMRQGEKSEQQKVLVEIKKKPMIGHVLELVSGLGIKRAIVVVGHQAEIVEKYLEEWRNRITIHTVKQEKQLGTADAVRRTEKFISDFKGDVLVLYGDTPLLTGKTLKKLVARHRSQDNYCTLLTTLMKNPTGYGRIVRNGTSDAVAKIVEEVDATSEEKLVKEVNVGVYCFKAKPLFEALKEVKPNNQKNEYYLTDTIAILSRREWLVRSVLSEDPHEVLGVNSPMELAKVRLVYNRYRSPKDAS